MIFIAGNSRSGTALLGRILNKHSDIFTFHELHFLEETWMPVDDHLTMSKEKAIQNFSNLLSIERDGYLKKRQPEKYYDEALSAIDGLNTNAISYASLYKSFLNYETTLQKKKFPCEKTPRNVLYINELLRIYPECKIICMMRDPKDVLLSQKKKWKRRYLGTEASIPFSESVRARINYHPFIIARLWNANARAIAAHKKTSRAIIVSFENLIVNSEEQVRSICSFLGIPFQPEMLRVEKIGSSVDVDNKQELEIDQSKTGNWKHGLNRTEIFICDRLTRTGRMEFNYPDTKTIPDYLLLVLYYLIFPFQLMLAFLVNVGRTKNIFQSIKKRLS